MKKPSQQYKNGTKPIWCPGCGDYAVYTALSRVFDNLCIDPWNIAMVSGIGCSGRFSHYFNVYSLHGTHGRALPTATGLKVANPALTVLAVGGDGDGMSIGGGHIAHCARKNPDLTYLMLDNTIYGLTKGQLSPTTPQSTLTKTTPWGHGEPPLDPLPMFLSYDAAFVARAQVRNTAELQTIIEQAISFRGFSIVQILSPCVTYKALSWEDLESGWQPLPDSHKRDDKLAAMALAYSREPMYSGIFYQKSRPTLEDRISSQRHTAGWSDVDGDIPHNPGDVVSSILDGFR